METQAKGAKNIPTWYLPVIVVLSVASTVLISNTLTDYKMSGLLTEIENSKVTKSKSPTIKTITQSELVNFFSKYELDTQTQMEYLDLLEIILSQNNIIVIEASTIQFGADSSKLKLPTLDILRAMVSELGIENPRIVNQSSYEEREKLQNSIMEMLTKRY